MSEEEEVPEFKQAYHVKYFSRCMQSLPYQYTSLDSNRLTLAYFCLSALDILGGLDEVVEDKQAVIDWIYGLQVVPTSEERKGSGGFRGGTYLGNTHGSSNQAHALDNGHITMTYAALNSLLALGDDLSRVDKQAVSDSLRALQQQDGSYSPTVGGSESDMRFLYCACAVAYILDDWSGVDCDRALAYIQQSQTYEGGFAQGPHLEAHGGSTYCAIASLVLMDKLDTALDSHAHAMLLRWLLGRQVSGFQGRVNKIPDTCYSFWIGASLSMLGYLHLADWDKLQVYSLRAQFVVGGIRKWPDPQMHPDVLHSYLGLCGFALQDQAFGVRPIVAALNGSEAAMANVWKGGFSQSNHQKGVSSKA